MHRKGKGTDDRARDSCRSPRSWSDDWTTAVRAHTAGTIDEPVKTIASWPSGCFTLVLGLASRTPNAARTLTLGLSLHTDIAIAEFYWPPEIRPDAVILVDGQVTGYIGRSAHWRIAQLIAADLVARPGEGPRVAAWYRATAALMQEWRALDLQGMHIEAGQTLFVDDPVPRCTRARSARLSATRDSTTTCERSARPRARASRHWPAATALRWNWSNATRVELGIARRELRRA